MLTMLKTRTKHALSLNLTSSMKKDLIGLDKHFLQEKDFKKFVRKNFDVMVQRGVKTKVQIRLTMQGRKYMGFPPSYDGIVHTETHDSAVRAIDAVAKSVYSFILGKVVFNQNQGNRSYSLSFVRREPVDKSDLIHEVDVSQIPPNYLPTIACNQQVSDTSNLLEETKDLLDPEILDYVDSFDLSSNAVNQDKWQELLTQGSPIPPVHKDDFMSSFDLSEFDAIPELAETSLERLSIVVGLHVETLNAASQKNPNDIFPEVKKFEVPDLLNGDFVKSMPDCTVPAGQTVGMDTNFQDRSTSKKDTIAQAAQSVYESILSVAEWFKDKFVEGKMSGEDFFQEYKVFRQTPGIRFYLPVFFYVFKKVELWATSKLDTKAVRLIWAPTVFEWVLGMLLCKVNHAANKCQFWKGYSHGVVLKEGGFELLLSHLARYNPDPQFDKYIKELIAQGKDRLELPDDLFDDWFKSALKRRAGNDADFKQWDVNQYGMNNHGFFRYDLYSYDIDFDKLSMKDVIFLSLLIMLEEWNVNKMINLNGVIVAIHRMLASGVFNTAHMGSFSNGWCQRSYYTAWYFALRELVYAMALEEEGEGGLGLNTHVVVDYNCPLIQEDPKMKMMFPRKGERDKRLELKVSILTSLKTIAYVHFSDDYLSVSDWLSLPVIELVDKARYVSDTWAHSLYPNLEKSDSQKPYDAFHDKVIDQMLPLVPARFKVKYNLSKDAPQYIQDKNDGPHGTMMTGNLRQRLATYRPLLSVFNYDEAEQNLSLPDSIVNNWAAINDGLRRMFKEGVGEIKVRGVNFLKNFFSRNVNVVGIFPVRDGKELIPKVFVPTKSTNVDLDVYHIRRTGQLTYNAIGHPYVYALIRSVTIHMFTRLLGLGKNLVDEPIDEELIKDFSRKIGEITHHMPDFNEMTYKKLFSFYSLFDDRENETNKKFIYRENSRSIDFRSVALPNKINFKYF